AATGQSATQNDAVIADDQGRYQGAPFTAEQSRVAEITLKVVQEEAARLSSSRQLQDETVRQKVIERVQRVVRENIPTQNALPGMELEDALTDEKVSEIVHNVTERLAELTIDIPQITVLPTREVNYGFKDFDLAGLEKINFQPVGQEILLQHLEDNRITRIKWGADEAREEILENYIVRNLMAIDAIDYDEHAELLYKLAGQVIARLGSYLGSERAKIENVLIYWQKQLCDFVWAQMKANSWSTPTDYIGRVTQGFDILHPTTYMLAAGEQPRDFRAPITNKSQIKQMVFKGFQRCCYPYQKFGSVDGEWRLAQLLESDDDVLRWMKPAPGQFRIEYLNGKNYEPDFVVETRNCCLLIEPKRSDQIPLEEVQQKTKAAVRWCGFANESAEKTGTKKWHYLLVPHDAIELGRSIATLQSEFIHM
ncbi:MAG: restriction endonuclease subunit R, partial [Gammaproteobacteria bacterium]|nr:restriction endonuclease subunit R [Gammaproteobacteria bacterium]